MANREAYATLAKDPELTGRPLKVLLYLLSKLNYENWIQVPQTEIAEELGIHPASVSKEIHLLLRRKILLRGPKVGHSYAFRLNPYYAWRGDSRKERDSKHNAAILLISHRPGDDSHEASDDDRLMFQAGRTDEV